MTLRPIVLAASLALAPIIASAAMPNGGPVPVQVVTDRAAFLKGVRALGHAHRAATAATAATTAAAVNAAAAQQSSFPHFNGAFRYQGVTYPYTMVGYPPASGRTARIQPVIVPLRMNFLYFTQSASFDPAPAVTNLLQSPLFNNARFPNGVGQFGDMLQRATFWNRMDAEHDWHVLFQTPRVLPTIDVPVEPDVGELYQFGTTPDTFYGNLRFGAMDAIIHALLQFIDVRPNELPIFVTYNVTADALGYHDAIPVAGGSGAGALQTLIYTSWLEPTLFGDLLADVSTINHEVGEWLNDPYVNNVVPTWSFPGISQCGGNLLEVGDPEGNGPNYADFPTVPIPLNGYLYHFQDLVLLPWFAEEVPSSARGGWYDFPATTYIHAPAAGCAP